VEVVTAVSAQSPDFVVVVTPFTELTETVHELLVAQPALFVVVVTPFTDFTETLHEDELRTATLLDTVTPRLVIPATDVSPRVPEPPANACSSATCAPSPASAKSASSAAALRIPTPRDDFDSCQKRTPSFSAEQTAEQTRLLLGTRVGEQALVAVPSDVRPRAVAPPREAHADLRRAQIDELVALAARDGERA
jgi:hypothetical protein